MSADLQDFDAACHCGAVKFRIRLADGFDSIRRCNCTYCRMRGAISVSVPRSGISSIKGKDNLTLYQFHTRTAKHFFCKTCGIHTHHQRRSNPDLYGVNVACLEGVSPFDFPEVKVANGTLHPSDYGTTPEIAGILRFAKQF